METFSRLFMGSGSSNGDKKNVRPYKVKKAVDFLSSREIQSIDAFNTKVKFLRTRGLNEDEIKEAFSQSDKVNMLSAPHLDLHDISSHVLHDESSPSSFTMVPQNQMSPVSTLFSVCHKLLVFAGITSSLYYLYQQWSTMRKNLNKSKNEDAAIKEELRQVKLALLRLSGDLKHYEGVQENQTKLLAEINSLKAIFTSRQYFEERKTTKLALPSWQLKSTPQSTSATSTAPLEEVQNTCDVQSNQTNGHIDGIEPKTKPRKSKSKTTSENEPVLDEGINTVLESTVTNSNSVVTNETVCNTEKESNIKTVEKRKESKKNDKKNHSKN